MSIYAANNSEQGFAAFDAFSAKSTTKYNVKETTREREHYRKSPPTNSTAGKLYYFADQKHRPGWRQRYEESLLTDEQRAAYEWIAAWVASWRLLRSSAEFVAGFVPPDYLIDGLVQRRYIYALTAPTGFGKTSIALRITAHVALGMELAGMEVEQGTVLYFAGENPDDVRTRWIKQCEELGQDPDKMDVVFFPDILPIQTSRYASGLTLRQPSMVHSA